MAFVAFRLVTVSYDGSSLTGGISSQAGQSQYSGPGTGAPAPPVVLLQPVVMSMPFGTAAVHTHSASQSSWRSTAAAHSTPPSPKPDAAAAAAAEVALLTAHE